MRKLTHRSAKYKRLKRERNAVKNLYGEIMYYLYYTRR